MSTFHHLKSVDSEKVRYNKGVALVLCIIAVIVLVIAAICHFV